MKDQTVVLEEGLTGRLEKARLRDMAKVGLHLPYEFLFLFNSEYNSTQKEAFVVQLAKHSDAGRFHSQDAVLQPRTKDPYAMLTLPEFIREPMPLPEDARAMLTLPESHPTPHLHDVDTGRPTSANGKAKKNFRHRSLSAPSLSWLRSSSSRLGSSSSVNANISTSHSRSYSRGQSVVPNGKRITNIKSYYICPNYLLTSAQWGLTCATLLRTTKTCSMFLCF